MCGIGGIYRPGGLGEGHEAVLGRMANSLAHRGPDGRGIWSDPAMGIGLCHARLAVLDLSERGRQPMTTHDGRGRIVYNGEVYNYRELRSELEGAGCRFISGTDTEVVLAACLHWGVEEALARFNGMFAFALWMEDESSLYLARDRMGIKPLYYGTAGGGMIFGSELKALCAHRGFPRDIDPRSLELYLMLQYVPTPRTIFRDAGKLPPGHYLCDGPAGRRITRYWDPPVREKPRPSAGKPGGAAEQLDGMLGESVRMRLVSDVPLGAFLSGGVDSALVVSRMKEEVGPSLEAFTVSYGEDEFDEGPYASEVATHLGIDHRCITVTMDDLLGAVEELPVIYDEPLSDPSSLPLVLLSRIARDQVTVVLSGDGGDELLGGYDRYRYVDLFSRRVSRLPVAARAAAARILGTMPTRLLAGFYNTLRRRARGRMPFENFAGKWEKLIRLLVTDSPAAAYQASVGIFTPEETGRLLGRDGAVMLPEQFTEALQCGGGSAGITDMMDLDRATFLTDDVLAKVDRAGMAAGLEIRVPLLDHRIVELCAGIPAGSLFDGGRGKAPLRSLARGTLPVNVWSRPKMGFSLPLDSWLRTSLKEYALDHLGSASRSADALLDREERGRLIHEHMSGRANHHEKLWNLLVLVRWMERWTPGISFDRANRDSRGRNWK